MMGKPKNSEKAGKRTMKEIIISLLFKAAIIYILVCIGLFFIQKKIIFVPTKGMQFSPKDYSLKFNEQFIESENGNRIHTWYMPSETNRGFVLFCHGNGGNMGHRLQIADFLVNSLGLNVLFFDYQGYGDSEGSPSEKAFYMDGNTCMEHLKCLGAKEENTIIFGKSIGCGVAVEMAVRNKVAGVVLESPPSSIPDVAKRKFPFFPVGLIVFHRFDSLSKIHKVHSPLMIFHCPKDELVPYELGKKLFSAANKPKLFHDLTDGHNELEHFSKGPYKEQWEEFLKKYLCSS